MRAPDDPTTGEPSLSDLPTEAGASTAEGGRPGMPERIGAYRVTGLLGQGGMGSVYLAEQTAPVRRRVAVKLISTNLAGPHAEARFAAERQALARLSHPNVAQLFEAGTTEEGFPYFVMELVDGPSLVAHCDHVRLSVEQRLELFLEVCAGVEHAHRKGIIHRDLKPSNLLVAETGGRAVPKVIDFGIAKALDEPLTGGGDLTAHGFVGTPAYMSPEALLTGGSGDVDTRTDVYALGVLLCELLTGARPHRDEELGLVELVKQRTRDPARRPSTLLAELDDGTQGRVAGCRATDPFTLAGRLRGDLDWIVLKAVAREREERYGSVAELGEDIRRSLADLPVSARPPSRRYRLSKFLRRHSLAVSAAVVVAALIVAFAVTMAVQARRIAAERDRANAQAELATRVSSFLAELFEEADPESAQGGTITARELLDRGAERIEHELSGQPEVQARLMATIGTVYESMGLFADAERLLRRALAAQRAVLGPRHPETLTTFAALNEALYRQGRYDELATLDPELLALRRETLGTDHPDTLTSVEAVAILRLDQGRLDEAEVLFHEALAGARRVHGERHPVTLGALANMAALARAQGRLEAAAATYREALEIQREVEGEGARATLTTVSMLGVTLHELGRLDEAERLLTEALDGRTRLLGPSHDGTLMSVANLADLIATRGDHAEAERRYRALVATRLAEYGEDHHWSRAALHGHGRELLALGRLDEAGERLQRAHELERRAVGPSHPDALAVERSLARLRLAAGGPAEAWAILEPNLAATRAAGGDGRALGRALELAGEVLSALGRREEAGAALDEAAELLAAVLPEDHPDLVAVRGRRAAIAEAPPGSGR